MLSNGAVVGAVSHQLGAQESYGYALGYNQVGQISRKTERRHDGSLVTYDYTYDNRYRLVEVTENGQVTEAYSYDANGNRISVTSTHRDITNQNATYVTGDQLQSQGNTVYSYDANGRLSSKLEAEGEATSLTTYVYSSLGQLLQVDTAEHSIEYRHNALGQRVAKLVNGQVTEKYLWRDLTTLLATYDASGNIKQRFGHTLGHTPTSFTQNGQRYFIQSDHLGSPRVITDSSGAVVKTINYDSYGNVIEDSSSSFEIPFGFAGGLHDKDTGLIRFGFRDYDPNTGRWTARDPIGFAGGDTNLYGYVLGDPVNGVDPIGLIKFQGSNFNDWKGVAQNEKGRQLADRANKEALETLKENGGQLSTGISVSAHGGGVGYSDQISLGIDTDGKVCLVRTSCFRLGPGYSAGMSGTLSGGIGKFCPGMSETVGGFLEAGKGPFSGGSIDGNSEGLTTSGSLDLGVGGGASGGGQYCQVATWCP